jgi:hypothetical protein
MSEWDKLMNEISNLELGSLAEVWVHAAKAEGDKLQKTAGRWKQYFNTPLEVLIEDHRKIAVIEKILEEWKEDNHHEGDYFAITKIIGVLINE